MKRRDVLMRPSGAEARAATSNGPADANGRPAGRRRAARWAGYGAAVWAFVFALASFYWAAGGTVGEGTQGPTIQELAEARELWFVATLWITGVLKAMGGLIALAMAQPWPRLIPRWLWLLAMLGGLGLIAYGGIPLVVNGLMGAGIVSVPEPVDWTAIWWHFLLWDPWWLLGGVLFTVTALTYRRAT